MKLDAKKKVKSIANYIDDCQSISNFRDENFAVKNYRIFDNTARRLGGTEMTRKAGILEFVDRILKEYAGEKSSKKTPKKNELAEFIKKTAPERFYGTNIIDKSSYVIKGSVGNGNWAATPWLAIFKKPDPPAKVSAQRGVYIIYLLSQDYKSLYLTLNQGCTGLISDLESNKGLSKRQSKEEAIRIMRKIASDIAAKIDNRGFEIGEINLGGGSAECYEKGSIFSKKYEWGSVPSEEELQKDLFNMVEIYKDYVDKFIRKNPADQTESEKAVEIMNENIDKNMILYGPPGTGKTYSTAKYAVAICDELSLEKVDEWEYEKVLKRYNELKELKRVAFTTFHQSYGYEEFIEGIKPEVDDHNNVIYKVEDGLFKKFCEIAGKSHDHVATSNADGHQATGNENINKLEEPNLGPNETVEDHPYVFVIDEINRGNISKIFGELITLIENTKRKGAEEAMEVVLPYSGDLFSVPNNVYILGTMNTADRSIALMDTALRRRFGFVEMMPDASLLDGVNIVDNSVSVNIGQMLRVINERITFLYDREHTIGHAFFMKLVQGGTVSDLAEIFKKSVVPLLQEYFYEDYEKIRLVLGDSAKKDKDVQFIQVKDISEDLFDIDVSETIDISERRNYTIVYKNFDNIMAYKGISKKL